MLVLKGVPASPGIAIGPAILLPGEQMTVSRQYIAPAEASAELRQSCGE